MKKLYDVIWAKHIPAMQGRYSMTKIHDYLKAHGVVNLGDEDALQYIRENGGQVWTVG